MLKRPNEAHAAMQLSCGKGPAMGSISCFSSHLCAHNARAPTQTMKAATMLHTTTTMKQ